MQCIRNIRRTIKKDRKILLSNLLWFLVGIVALPTSVSILNWLSTLSPQFLSSAALTEFLIILILLISLLSLRDKISVANIYFKDNKISWDQLESDADFGEAFDEAAHKDTK